MMKNPRKINVTQDMLDEHAISTNPPPPDSLFWEMWFANTQVAQNALNTPFVQEIKLGILNPTSYGAFCVNDAYYCFQGAGDYLEATKRAKAKGEKAIAAFLEKKAESYAAYNQQFTQQWHVKDASGVIPVNVTENYAAFESSVAKNEDPIYILIAMLPCEYLWAWLGQQLNAFATDNNLYKGWITGNQGFHGAYAMGNFIHSYRGDIEKSKALQIYTEAITFEWKNFFAGIT